MSTLSHRVLDVIGGCPEFCSGLDSGQRPYLISLSDGAKYRVPEDSLERDEGLIAVSWPGRPDEEFLFSGRYLAEKALLRDTRHEHLIGRENHLQKMRSHLLSHLDWKTSQEPWREQPAPPQPNARERAWAWLTAQVTYRRCFEAVIFSSIGAVIRTGFIWYVG